VLTGLLGGMLATGVPVDDDEIWRLHDAATRQANRTARPPGRTAPA